MLAVACVLLYLAIVKQFEPLLLLPIGFGMLMTNLPLDGIFHMDIFINETNHINWELLDVYKRQAVDAHGGVQGVQAGGDLHALGLVDGLAIGQVDAGLLQCGAAVGELVLNHKVLRALGVDKGSDEGVLGGDDGSHALDAVLLQGLLDHLVGARGDLCRLYTSRGV